MSLYGEMAKMELDELEERMPDIIKKIELERELWRKELNISDEEYKQINYEARPLHLGVSSCHHRSLPP